MRVHDAVPLRGGGGVGGAGGGGVLIVSYREEKE